MAEQVLAQAVGTESEWLKDYATQFMKSRTWAGPIKEFIDDHCGIFDTTDPEENKLEYTQVHDCFKDLIDSLLAAHLLEVDISPEAFAACYDANAKADSEFAEITQHLVSVSDFLVFKKMMIARNRSLLGIQAPVLPEVKASEESAKKEDVSDVPIAKLPTPARKPGRADRIAEIVGNATKKENQPDAKERAAMVRAALTELLVAKR
mmetsp:Transcript_82756/g.146136  ORF Transcript_82756/g.146136 Transcript_82756/m.146136 type:complete len:207 (-) Transcript_82756:149-769(-)